ncbi:MAG: hypothetical protein SVK08_03705 [Halobacteriota archaeon]|nr:hypothetical protein [Halobacteriota archaeon]
MKATCRICGNEWETRRRRPQCPECKSIDVEVDKPTKEIFWTRFRCLSCSYVWDAEKSSDTTCPKCGSQYVKDLLDSIILFDDANIDTM